MIIFFISENFSKNRGSTQTWGTFLAQFTSFSSFLKTFQKIEKNEVFAHHGPFWLNSHMCPFFIQMSEIIYFSCPGGRI